MFPNVLFCCSFCCCVFGLVLAFSDLLLCFWSVCVLHLQTTETPPYLSWVFPVGCTWMNLIVCSFSPLISTHLVNWACWIRSRGQEECSLIGCSAEQMSANQKLIRANRTNKNCQENTHFSNIAHLLGGMVAQQVVLRFDHEHWLLSVQNLICSSGFSSFLPPLQNIPVNGQVTLNCLRFEWVCSWCSAIDWHPNSGSKCSWDRLWIHYKIWNTVWTMKFTQTALKQQHMTSNE